MNTIHSSAAKRPTLPTLPTARSLRARSERPGILAALNRFAVRCRSAVCADQTQSHPRSGHPGILATMPRAALAALLMAFALTALAPTNANAQIQDFVTHSGTFTEAPANDGSVTGTLTFTLTGDTFTTNAGDFVTIAPTAPASLTAMFMRDSDSVVTLTFTGTADAHEDINDATLTFTFMNDAFTDRDAGEPVTIETIEIDFRDASTLTATGAFTEAPANDGSIIGTLTFTLVGDTFIDTFNANAANLVTIAPDVPAGLTPTFDRASTSEVTLTLAGTAMNHADANDATLTFTFMDGAFTNEAAATIDAPSHSIGIDFRDASTLTATGAFTEAPANDGSIIGTLTFTLVGDTFIDTFNANAANLVTIAPDVPAGLTPTFDRASTSEVTLTLAGTAMNHADANDATLTFTFMDGAFTNEEAATVADSTYSTGMIDFNDASTLAYAGTFTETAANDGTIEGSITATLTGDTFAADVVSGTHVTASNVPAGLTAAFNRDSDTVVTLTFTGTAAAHEDANDVTNLTIAFADDAFTAETAATVFGSTYATGMIDFNDTGTPMHELEKLNEQILSRTSQAMTASVSARVVARVEAAAGNGNDGTGDPSALAYQFGGYSSMHDLLQSHGKAMLEGEMEVAQLLDGASFVLPLSAAEGDSAGGIGGKLGALSLWGGSNLTQMDGDSNNLDWDGDMSSFHLGVDAPVGNNMLAGLALSLHQTGFDYNDNGQSGDYEYASTNLHPYFGYIHNDKLSLWGAAGLGKGEIEVDGDNANKLSTDTTHTSLAGGFNNQLLRAAGLLPDSVTTLNVKSDVSFVQVDVDSANAQDARFTAQTVDSHHLRLLVSGEQRSELADGGALASSAEIGVRYDGGDGVTGAGVEVGTGLRYAKPDGGLTLSGNVRGLLLDDYDEWGADFTVRLLPQSGRGLSLSLQPIWGQTQRTTEQLWNEGGGKLGDSDTALQSRMDSEVGYSIAAKMLGSTGVLTQYTGMTTADGGVSHVRLGSRFAGGGGLSLNLEGARKNDTDGASHTVLLRGELAF